MGGVATQARHLLSPVQRIGDFGNRVSGAGVSEAQRGVKLDFRNRLEIGLRHFLEAEEAYRIRNGRFRGVAFEAE
jgi:hypothetical protein